MSNMRLKHILIENEKMRMEDLREEVGTTVCIVGKIVKSRMKWQDTWSE